MTTPYKQNKTVSLQATGALLVAKGSSTYKGPVQLGHDPIKPQVFPLAHVNVQLPAGQDNMPLVFLLNLTIHDPFPQPGSPDVE